MKPYCLCRIRGRYQRINRWWKSELFPSAAPHTAPTPIIKSYQSLALVSPSPRAIYPTRGDAAR